MLWRGRVWTLDSCLSSVVRRRHTNRQPAARRILTGCVRRTAYGVRMIFSVFLCFYQYDVASIEQLFRSLYVDVYVEDNKRRHTTVNNKFIIIIFFSCRACWFSLLLYDSELLRERVFSTSNGPALVRDILVLAASAKRHDLRGIQLI
jgi:hypothetical protein